MEPTSSIVCIETSIDTSITIGFSILGPEKPSQTFTSITKRLWPYWERFFIFSFAWKSTFTYPDGRAQLTVPVPHVIGTWIVSAFSISQQNGLTVLPSVLSVNRYFIFYETIYGSVEFSSKARDNFLLLLKLQYTLDWENRLAFVLMHLIFRHIESK